MKERPGSKDRITKTRDFPRGTIEELGSSKDINRKDKESYEETLWQEKIKLSRVETRRQHVVGSQKHPVKMIFKEAKWKKIQIFWNHRTLNKEFFS